MKNKKVIVRYSESFKLQVVKEIEEGKYGITEAAGVYGIKGMGTIKHWMIKYGKLHLLPKIIRVETPNEKNKIKELEKQVKQLKQALADQVIKGHISEAFLEEACEKMGVSPEEFKKKVNKGRQGG